jgi:hypothetical protein
MLPEAVSSFRFQVSSKIATIVGSFGAIVCFTRFRVIEIFGFSTGFNEFSLQGGRQ